MKVRCIKLIDPFGEVLTSSPLLTIGKVYHVLSIELGMRGVWVLRLIDDNQNTGLYDIQQFEVVSARIPESWMVVWDGEGNFELTPKIWSEPGFWECYYEGDPVAERTFEQEMRKIIEADS